MKRDNSENKSLKELYRQLIIHHAKNPLNFGKLSNNPIRAEGINPLCGDKIRIYLNINEADTIEGLTFEGTGCAISIASASLMTTTLRNMKKYQANQYALNLISNLNEPKSQEAGQLMMDSQEINALEGVKDFPSRIKCATLSWQTFISALNNKKITTTEK
ncbi:SUF system NifU family Fe-S cluster assembly protein [Woeseiaceae bacterium]|nr:SUF system NifU family Fe-S cluster assembly protein [Woeseiaceae bacterium]